MTPKLQILRTADGYGLPLPMYESKDHMGLVLQAAIPDVIKLEPGDVVYLPVGFSIGIPRGMCGMILSIPDLVREKGIAVKSAPAILNPADRGPLFILIQNEGSKPQFINRAEAIAQLVISNVYQVCWTEVESDNDTEETPVSQYWVDKKTAEEAPVAATEQFSARRPVKSIRMRVK